MARRSRRERGDRHLRRLDRRPAARRTRVAWASTSAAASVPVIAGAALDVALEGGEEYELVVTAPPGVDSDAFEARFGVPLTDIGTVLAADGDAGSVLIGERVASQSGPRSFFALMRTVLALLTTAVVTLVLGAGGGRRTSVRACRRDRNSIYARSIRLWARAINRAAGVEVRVTRRRAAAQRARRGVHRQPRELVRHLRARGRGARGAASSRSRSSGGFRCSGSPRNARGSSFSTARTGSRRSSRTARRQRRCSAGERSSSVPKARAASTITCVRSRKGRSCSRSRRRRR